MNEDPPSGSELGCATAAAIFAPLPPVAILFELAVGGGPSSGALFLLVILFGAPLAAVHVLPLYLPAYILLSRERDLPWWGAAVLGLVCGGAPAFLLSGAEPTATALFAGAGLVGGLAFWRALTAARA